MPTAVKRSNNRSLRGDMKSSLSKTALPARRHPEDRSGGNHRQLYPDLSAMGLDVLRHVNTRQTGIPVILLAEAWIRLSWRCGQFRTKALTIISKNRWTPTSFASCWIARLNLTEAKRENERLRRQLQERGTFGELIGNSAPMREIYSLIEQVAPSSASVLDHRRIRNWKGISRAHDSSV